MPNPAGTAGTVSTARFQATIARIDAANAADPNTLVVDGRRRPKELAHAEMLTEWVQRLRPDAGEELLLAARAHHIRRWAIPRSSYPDGRKGYLRWRAALHAFHAEEAGRILRECGHEADSIRRVQQLVRKHGLGRDPEVQVLEDAMCLVFLQTQLGELRRKLAPETLANAIRKTWGKMSEDARQRALQLELNPEDLNAVQEALEVS